MIEGGSVQPLDSTAKRSVLALVIAALALAVVSGCAYPTAARPACADKVLDDWTKGTLEPTYSADCYDAAIDALPEDLRAYTTAADDISRVAMAVGRSDAPARQLASAPVQTESVRSFPVAIVLLAALVSAVAVSGTLAALIRRRRSR